MVLASFMCRAGRQHILIMHAFKALNYSMYKHFGLEACCCTWKANQLSNTIPWCDSSSSGLQEGTRALGKASLHCRRSSPSLPLVKIQNTSKDMKLGGKTSQLLYKQQVGKFNSILKWQINECNESINVNKYLQTTFFWKQNLKKKRS